MLTANNEHTPTWVNGLEVVASIRLWHTSSGQLPDGHMVIVRDRVKNADSGPPLFIVWQVARDTKPVRNDAGVVEQVEYWAATDGHYRLEYHRAIDIMTEHAHTWAEL